MNPLLDSKHFELTASLNKPQYIEKGSAEGRDKVFWIHWQQRKGIPCELITGFLKVMDIIWRIWIFCVRQLGSGDSDMRMGVWLLWQEQDRLWLFRALSGPQIIQQRSMNLQHQNGVITQATRYNLKVIASWLLRLCENRVLRKIFGPKGDEVTSAWRKPQRAELYALYSPPNIIFFSYSAGAQRGPWPPHSWEFYNTWRTSVGRTPLEKWSARRRDLYLTTHNTHNRQVFMTPVGFEPIIPASERPQTDALDRAVTAGTGTK
jgi:hypothetical protein